MRDNPQDPCGPEASVGADDQVGPSQKLGQRARRSQRARPDDDGVHTDYAGWTGWTRSIARKTRTVRIELMITSGSM